ncbi:MAG TPA: shikimate dehydrogenase [Candidatus Sulfotelmatobacter sp.]|nr:shikimate dehydrogenase [Candidatus Sulfotelmatobacter sp.]
MTLSGKALLAGVMGWPVSHSRSPRLHGFWLRQHGIDGAYVPLAVRPEDLAAAARALPLLGFRGCNVTSPHKGKMAALVDVLDPLARRIGAVNTVVVLDDGRLEGRNTDAFGFLENLRSGAAFWRADGGPAVVLGAGGAARAVVAALQEAGAPEIRLLNRSRERAERLAADLGKPVTTLPWNEVAPALRDAALLVNCTSLGMTGQPPLAVDLASLPGSALVTDLVYSPLKTPLLQAAAERGNPTVDGLGMLLHQARPGFTAWFGVAPTVTPELRAHVLA